MVVDVVTEIKSTKLDRTFAYHVPPRFENDIKIGARVTIPFGGQILEGFVVSFNQSKTFDFKLKDIIDIVDYEPVLNTELLELGNYISKRALCSKTQAYQAMLPVALKARRKVHMKEKYETYLILSDKNFDITSKKQQEIIDLFKNDKPILKKRANLISTSAVKTLLGKGILKEEQREIYRLVPDDDVKRSKPLTLTPMQQEAYDTISNSLSSFKPFLLHGVTGSGKTEVYLQLIQKVLDEKKEAIVLVPEISLTPQLVQIFKSRFGSTIAILHSGLSNSLKYDEWRKVVRGEVSIVIGARSAIFAPFTNLGIIIIDEEHSDTYKQDVRPHYDAIDIALRRAKRYNIPVVLGSATPSMESYTRAISGVYTLVSMNERINKRLPRVSLVDMKEEVKHGRRLFSKELEDKIIDRLHKKEQIMILLNRRGYATVLNCHDCGYTDTCPRCDVPLIYHKQTNDERCHYCGYQKPILTVCPSCKSEHISMYGYGTQKLEEELRHRFPARVLRMDVDTTSKKGSHSKIINAFARGEYDILVGTQMIAKGLDFPNVTLVGVLQCDALLSQPDFRSAERTFSLLSQVAGRSGRSRKKGEVIFQGFNIDHYSIQMASKHDYLSFYREELKLRKALKYPPYCHIATVRMQSRSLNQLEKEMEKVAKYMRLKLPGQIILGPSVSAHAKVNYIYYMQVYIKYKKLKDIYHVLEFLYTKYKVHKSITIDIITD